MEKIKVVSLIPGETAEITELGSSLEEMQEYVGGLIQAIYPFDEEVCIVCNDEGKLLGLPVNRALRDSDGEVYDAICGNAFICDCSGEEFGSLSDEQLCKYSEMFKHPEMLVKIDGAIEAIPY